jgi:predicted permease
MREPREYRRYFRLRLGRRDAERELDEEIEAHIAMRAEALEQGGETPERARAEAVRRFGDVSAAKRRLRESAWDREVRMTRRSWWGAVHRDIRHALRQFWRVPGYAAAVVLIFAAGIGLTTAMYTIVDHVLLRSLPYPGSERLVGLLSVDSAGREYPFVSLGNWMDWRAQGTSLSRTALHFPRSMTVRLADETVRVSGQVVVGDFFAVMGTRPTVGRAFTVEEVARGEALAVVSERFWRARLSAKQLPVDLVVDGRAVQVMGVLRRDEEYPAGTDVYVGAPYRAEGGALRNNVSWYALARLAPDASAERARAELGAIAQRIRATDPAALYSYGVGLESLRDRVVGGGARSLVLLMAGVALVLLIACANIAGLSLARASTRTQEVAVRMALGASAARVRAQIVVEVLVLAGAGGALGAVLAVFCTRILLTRAGAWIPRVQEISVDGRVLAFASLATLLAGLLAALAPALRSSRASIRELVGHQRGAVRGGRNLPGAVLVTCEVALALMLLTGGSLLWRSFRAVLSQELGYDATGVVTADLALTPAEYRGDRDRQLAFWNELLRRTRDVQGVGEAGLANAIPTGGGAPTFVEIEGLDVGRAAAGYRITSDDYFRVLRIPLLVGRGFDARDTREGPRVAIVNQRFVDVHLRGVNPLGHRVRAASSEGFGASSAPWLTVIGVVGNVRHWSFEAEPDAELYVLYRQTPAQITAMTLVARTSAGGLTSVGPTLRSQVRSMDPGVGADIATLQERVRMMVGERRLTMSIINLFAAIALTLAAVGVYGLISFAVSQRTREIGVRAALGAGQPGLVRLILSSALRVLGLGAALGLAGALALGRMMGALLFGVGTTDILSFGTAAFVLLVVTLSAAAVPAWRASRLDPLEALRQG